MRIVPNLSAVSQREWWSLTFDMEPELSSELASQLMGQGGGDAVLLSRRKQHKKRKAQTSANVMSKDLVKELKKQTVATRS